MKKIELDKNDLMKSLKLSKLFKLLKDEELEYIISISEIQEFEKEDEIIEEGDISPYMYSIIKGSVNVVVRQKVLDDVKDVYICTIGEGDVIGEAAIFLNVKRTAFVIANETTQLLILERKKLVNFIKKYPGAGIKILMIIIYSLLHKLRGSNQELAFERKAFLDQNDIDDLISNFSDSNH